MKGVLSSNIEHYRYTAEALQEADYLDKYICGAFYNKKPWYYPISGKLKGWIDGRLESNIDTKLIKTLKNQEIIHKIIRNSPISNILSKSKIDKIFNDIFDYRSRRYLIKKNYISFYHYVSGMGYNSAVEAKKRLNCKIIIDDRAEHKEYLYNILLEEYKSLGIKFEDTSFWDIDCRKEYEIADYIVTPSTFSKQTFMEQGIKEDKLIVIPYGCDISRFYPITKSYNNKFRVIYVGSICIRKGVHYLIDAFKSIEEENIELLIIGKVENELNQYMEDLPQNIKHIEYVPNSELNKYYAQSDIFILPSLSDSFSLATLEAMASGLPVIISENVGAKDFVEDGESGYIVPIRDCESIRDRIIYLYNNRNICRNMGLNARKAVEFTTWQSYKHRIISFYNSLKIENNVK